MKLDRLDRILYVFGGEKAQGAEIVIDRLMSFNYEAVKAHLMLSPGNFADNLKTNGRPYPIVTNPHLKKLNRGNTGALIFYLTAVRNYFSISFAVYQFIQRNKIQAVHANTVVPASYLIPLILFCRIFKRDILWLWSDHDMSYFSGLDHFLSKRCVSLYDRTLVVSKAVQKKYGNHKHISVLYNGLDTEAFKSDEQKRNLFRSLHNFSDRQILIGMPAVVAPRKGQLDLIHTFNKLCFEFPNVFLLFAGGYEDANPEYSYEVKTAIDSSEFILHLGYIESMTDFYNGCDIIVSNSDLNGSEPLGTTIYEAMACERIVVASDTGGTKEIITHKEEGFLFEAENRVQLEQQLRYVISKINLLGQVRKSARKKVLENFNIGKMAAEYNKLIDLLGAQKQ